MPLPITAGLIPDKLIPPANSPPQVELLHRVVVDDQSVAKAPAEADKTTEEVSTFPCQTGQSKQRG
jgi:hypothetical protein